MRGRVEGRVEGQVENRGHTSLRESRQADRGNVSTRILDRSIPDNGETTVRVSGRFTIPFSRRWKVCVQVQGSGDDEDWYRKKDGQII
jgi:hypothetical protein